MDAPRPASAVLHVSSARGWRGGEQQVLHLMRGLAARGIRQHLLGPRDSTLVARVRAEGLSASGIHIRNEGDLRGLGSILGWIRATRPTTLHLHTSQAHGLGAVAARLAGRRRPGVVVTRRVEHSIFRHTLLGLDRIKYEPGADVVLCVSRRVRDVLLGDGIAADRLRVVPDGVPARAFASVPGRRERVRRELGLPRGAPVIGNVAHLEPAKGQRDLVRALVGLRAGTASSPAAPGARLLLVGEGRDLEPLRLLAREEGVEDRVVFAGFRSDVPALLDAMDVFAFPSRTEGLGSSVLEAMASATPIVASATGGVPEAVGEGPDAVGELVPPGDPAALARALAFVLADPDAARRTADRAAARAVRRFDVEAMVEGTLAAYEGAPRGYSPRSARTCVASWAGV